MRKKGDIKKKSPFGMEVVIFTKVHQMTVHQLADASGVSYWTLRDAMTGSTAGNKLIPKVRDFMVAYTAQHKGGGGGGGITKTADGC